MSKMMIELNDSQKRKYLARVLQMNPVRDANKIMNVRSVINGTKSVEEIKAERFLDRQADRDHAQRRLAEIRQRVWTTQSETLQREIAAIDVTHLPDLKSSVDRLKLVVKFQSAFHKLSQHSQQNTNLMNTLKRVMMLSPREAGALKEQYLRQIVESPQLRGMKNMVIVMKREFPPLYAIESDWLDRIANLNARKQLLSSRGTAEDYEPGIPGWVLFILGAVGLRLIIWIFRSAT